MDLILDIILPPNLIINIVICKPMGKLKANLI